MPRARPPPAPGSSSSRRHCPWTSIRPRACCCSSASRPKPCMPTEPPLAGRVEVIALDGVPEVQPGDDLPALLVAAIAQTPDLLPLQPGDTLVVTQKIVSKAEGAIVDLRGIEPRPEAMEFGRRWDRDPRQVE